nr:hypothetical protein [Streptomyces sp. BA2]
MAERPRPVGVLAQLAEARQPQTTKHLQVLDRAGVVTYQRRLLARWWTPDGLRVSELVFEAPTSSQASRSASARASTSSRRPSPWTRTTPASQTAQTAARSD